MGSPVEQIRTKIRRFKQRYYVDTAIRGLLLSATVLTLYFLLAAILESSFWLNSASRFVLIALFAAVAALCFVLFLRKPVWYWLSRKGLDDEQSARILGIRMPAVRDRLLNLIQLARLSRPSPLASASISQKAKEFEPVSFEGAVSLKENRRYLKYALIPAAIVGLILLINASTITESTHRILHFSEKFSPKAPFDFIMLNNSLKGFRNEDFTLRLKLEGTAVPDQAYLVTGTRRIKLLRDQEGHYTYTFDHLGESIPFQIEAAGFYSVPYEIEVADRPELTSFEVDLNYPGYLGRPSESIPNTGNLEIPEGTAVSWNIGTSHAQEASMLFGASPSEPQRMNRVDDQAFTFTRRFHGADPYEIRLRNDDSDNKNRIAYRVDVIKDAFPEITVNSFPDSVFYKSIGLGGMISDDHGLTRLALHYDIIDAHGEKGSGGTFNLPLMTGQSEQSFFYPWMLDSLALKPGERLEYYLSVWDNDGVNGRKASRSSLYTFMIPGKDELITHISQSANKTADKFDRGVNKATELRESIDQISRDLKGKQSLDWQDRKKLEDLLQQRKELDKLLEELSRENEMLDKKKDAFTEQNERIREKAEQIRKLMNELLDDETRKLFEELEKLLQEKIDLSQMKDLLDKLNQNSSNLEKELERTLELFRQMQYDFKFDQLIKDLKEQIAGQKEIQEETQSITKDKADDRRLNGGEENQTREDRTSELAQEQEQLNESFNKTEQQMEELRKMADEMKENVQDLPTEEDTREIRDSQEESKEMLEKNSPSKANDAQQKAIEQMQSMQQQMESMQNAAMIEIDMKNVEMLRQILHGLIKLSFDQENLLNEFKELQQNDPRFNKLAQDEISLKDDSKVLEDSLLALGKRDPFMGSFISREVSELNSHFDKSIEAYRARNRPQAMGEMQATMTSINDLALMLDDHYDMLMNMMANARASGKKPSKGKPPSLGQLQQQLNQRIEQLKNSGKTGRELSEELARMAAEQERIRRALQELQEKMDEKNQGATPGNDLPSQMEETELDLVNKQLTEELIRRQHEILTRLLEAEKSLREQDVDDEREGETAKDYEKVLPKALEDYLRLKEKEIELIRTVPPKLYPFYKDEVNKYFKRITE